MSVQDTLDLLYKKQRKMTPFAKNSCPQEVRIIMSKNSARLALRLAAL